VLAPGTRIGSRYVIDRLLGQGGMSNLYIATDLTQGNSVRVIKEMTARYADPKEQENAEKLFMREAELLATLNHPHIPKVFDKFLFQGKYYLSMEYCPGQDLGQMIQDRGTIEEKWAATWGAQMATVLYYLHRQNPPIVFRDVKPSNIMIVQDQVKLIDFGIARLFNPTSKKGDTMRIGSPGYAPPEQYSGQTDPRSDIYALGMTLLHAVTGYDPTTTTNLFQHPKPRDANPRVSAEMEAVILRATQLDPDKRYDNCLEMKRDLQGVMRQHGVLVGISAPFTAQQQVSAQAAASATTPATGVQPPPIPSGVPPTSPPTPVGVAGPTPAAASTLQQGSQAQAAPVAAPTPSATSATPTATSPAGTPTPGPQPKRFRLGPLLFALVAVALGVTALKAPPAWKDAAGEQLRRLMSQLQWLMPVPAPARSEAEQVLLAGGPIMPAAEALGQVVRQGKASPEQILTYQNALVYASGRPFQRMAVIAPASRKVAETLVAWQRSSWNESNRDGKLLVVSLENVDKDWSGAIRRATSGELFRDRKLPETMLVFPPESRPAGWNLWFEGAPPLYWVGESNKQDPPSAKVLPTLHPAYSDWLTQAQLGDCVWLARRPAAPASIKSEPYSVEGVARLLKQNPRPTLVVDEEQLKGLEGWPKVPGTRLLTIYDPGSLPPQPPPLPAGYKLQALTQASVFAQDSTVGAFFLGGTPLNAAFFDSLSWAGSQLLGETRQTGLSWHTNRNGEVEPAHWQVLEARQGNWVFLKEGGEKP